MDLQIELLTVGPGHADHVTWAGPRRSVAATSAAVAAALSEATADAVLCLGAELPIPPRDLLDRLLAGPADAWHAGLRLGLAGQPTVLDHVAPLWMLNAPLDPDVEATSWRLSLRATLVRRSVLDQLGGPDPGFASLAGAGLDLGMRWIRAGALVRHVPDLVPAASASADPAPPPADGLRLVGRHHGRTWAGWALQRAVLGRELGPVAAARLVGDVRRTGRAPLPTYRAEPRPPGSTDRRITVVLPTVDRYPTLVPLLASSRPRRSRPTRCSSSTRPIRPGGATTSPRPRPSCRSR